MTVKKLLRLPDDLAQKVREFRFDERLETEQEAYIRLLERGLMQSAPGPSPTRELRSSGPRKLRTLAGTHAA
jgi:hypothetical protein